MTRNHLAAVAVLALFAAGCDRDRAPSEKISDAAREVVRDDPRPLAEGPLAPRDDCASVEGAQAFRAALASAVEARDAAALASLAAPDVKLDFGGGSGARLLQQRLSAPGAELWEKLDDLLRLGCAKNREGGITLPWVFDQDLGDIDPMMGMLVTAEKAPLRAAPAADAPLVTTVSWDAVTLQKGLSPDAEFQQVRTRDGKAGYIATDTLRSLLDYRMMASSRDGKWSFTTLVAGD